MSFNTQESIRWLSLWQSGLSTSDRAGCLQVLKLLQHLLESDKIQDEEKKKVIATYYDIYC